VKNFALIILETGSGELFAPAGLKLLSSHLSLPSS
jgi:hypothetical protein